MPRQTAVNPLYAGTGYNTQAGAAASQGITNIAQMLALNGPNAQAAAAAQQALLAAQTESGLATALKTGAEGRIAAQRADALANPAEFLNRGYSTREALPEPLRGAYDTIADAIFGGGTSDAGSFGDARRKNEFADGMNRDFAGPLGVPTRAMTPDIVAERQKALKGDDLVTGSDNTIRSNVRREQPLITPMGNAAIRKSDAEAGKATADAGKGPPPKVIPATALDKLTSYSGQVDSMKRLRRTFKDDYGNNIIAGGMENVARSMVGDESGQAQWWKDYQQWANDVRHDLFGSALTSTEKSAFEAATIYPRMESGEIKKNLVLQQQLADSALKKYKGAASANWRNQEAVDAATLSMEGEQAADGATLMEDANGNTAWVYPDGRVVEVK